MNPKTRKEMYYDAILNGGNVPKPITREEMYLAKIAYQGGSGGDLSNYYSKSEVNELLDQKAAVNDTLRIIGRVDTVAQLPTEGNKNGDVYIVGREGSSWIKTEYYWSEANGKWDEIGRDIDTSLFIKAADVDNSTIAYDGFPMKNLRVKTTASYGLSSFVTSGTNRVLGIKQATDAEIEAGEQQYCPITPYNLTKAMSVYGVESRSTIPDLADTIVSLDTQIKNDFALTSQTLGYTSKNALKVTAVTTTVDGVTMTVNPDGSLTLNGTATARTAIPITNLSSRNSISTIPSKFILSGGTQMRGADCCIGIELSTDKNTGYIASAYDGDTGRTVDLSDYPTAKYWYALVRIESGINVDGITIYPMIRDADISDSTYAPYSKPSVDVRVSALENSIVKLDSMDEFNALTDKTADWYFIKEG